MDPNITIGGRCGNRKGSKERRAEQAAKIQERDHGNAIELTHLLARIHGWRLQAHRRTQTCVPLLKDNAPLGRGLRALGDLLPLLLLLLGVGLVRERVGVEVFAGGGVVVVGGGGQVEGRGGDAARAVSEPADEGASAAAHKPRALGIGRARGAGGRGIVLPEHLGTPGRRGERVAGEGRNGRGEQRSEADAEARGVVSGRGVRGKWRFVPVGDSRLVG